IGTPRFDFWLDIAVKLFTAVCVAVFTYQTFLAALRQTRAGEVWLAGALYLPGWAGRGAVPVPGFFMGLYLVLGGSAQGGVAARRCAPPRAVGGGPLNGRSHAVGRE